MGLPKVTQAQVVTQPTLDPTLAPMQVAFFDVNGAPLLFLQPGVAVANLTTPDGTDATSTQTLANATKAKLNDLLNSLRDKGIIQT